MRSSSFRCPRSAVSRFRNVLPGEDGDPLRMPMGVRVNGIDANSAEGAMVLDAHQGAIRQFRMAAAQYMSVGSTPSAGFQREIDGVRMRYDARNGQEFLTLDFSPEAIAIAVERIEEQSQEVPEDIYVPMPTGTITVYGAGGWIIGLNGTELGTSVPTPPGGDWQVVLHTFSGDAEKIPSYPARMENWIKRVYPDAYDQMYFDIAPEREDRLCPFLWRFGNYNLSGTYIPGAPDGEWNRINVARTIDHTAKNLVKNDGPNRLTATATAAGGLQGTASAIIAVEFYHLGGARPVMKTFSAAYDQPVLVSDYPLYMTCAATLDPGKTAEFFFDISPGSKLIIPSHIPNDDGSTNPAGWGDYIYTDVAAYGADGQIRPRYQ